MVVLFAARQGLNMGYDFLKQGANNLKGIGFGAAMPTERDRLLGAVTGETDAENKKKMEAMQAQIDSFNRKPATVVAMKKGGKVSSASKRADGCAIRGKTKGRMV
jgi:hypothetical protein